MAAIRIIKKYPNRRLYDTDTSAYITLADVKQLVMDNQSFVVRDAKSNEDLTRSILLQIILEEEAGGAPMFSDDLLYVATTRAGAPLDRITIAGLGFRARAVVQTAPEGIVLDLAGRGPVFIPRSAVRGVGRATWTIDRVVDQDGLIFVRWVLGTTEIDSYLRSTDPDRLVSALTPLAPRSSETEATP